MVDVNKLVELGIKALKNAHKVHEKLGDKGLESVQKNPHEHISLVGDMEAEKAVIDTFRESNIPLRIISEEHGQVDISNDPKYLAVLDGLDGTSVYKTAKGKGRYGTMFGVFSNLDPTYDDYIFGGMIEHSTKKIFYGVKNKGSFVIINNKKKAIKTSGITGLDNKTKIYADFEFDKNRKITFIQDTFLSPLEGYNFLHEDSMGIHLIDVASGNADLALHSSRKKNLEIATAYGIINEAGGIIVTKDGISVGKKKYQTLGQKEFIPIISASTMELAQELIHKIR